MRKVSDETHSRVKYIMCHTDMSPNELSKEFRCHVKIVYNLIYKYKIPRIPRQYFLSKRRRELIRAVALFKTNAEIMKELGLKRGTIQGGLNTIYLRYGLTRAKCVVFALKHRIVTLQELYDHLK